MNSIYCRIGFVGYAVGTDVLGSGEGFDDEGWLLGREDEGRLVGLRSVGLEDEGLFEEGREDEG